MNILIVNNTSIPVKEYGGSERIIWWLGRELVRLGHKVSYLVTAGSSCPFADVLVWDRNKPLNDQIPNDIDLVHLNFQTNEQLKKPYLITHHGNFHPHETFNINTVFVSKNHAERNGSATYVYNGIDPDDYSPVDFNYQRKYLLFLGWATRPEKNLKDCLYIARKTKNVLAVVGGKDKWFKRRPWVEYKGFIGGEEKNNILRNCKALLFPVRWHEPFGIALLESLYFGSPVFGSCYGALPEVITPEVGFLSNSRAELVRAVNRLDEFSPKRCHEYICDQFTSKHLAQRYLELYQKVLSGQTLNPTPPKRGDNYIRGELLPFYK